MSGQGWTDFQSGACMCKRSTDYDSIRGGADDYESTIGAKPLLYGQGYTMNPSKTASQKLAGLNMRLKRVIFRRHRRNNLILVHSGHHLFVKHLPGLTRPEALLILKRRLQNFLFFYVLFLRPKQ